MTSRFEPARESDLSVLLGLMRDFYASEHLPFDPAVASHGLAQLFSDPSAGAVYLIGAEREPIGYFVLGFNFSLEFHGRYAWIDELYVREPHRGAGIGRAALAFVESLCRERGFAAIRLEVARRNTGAARLYRRLGYEDYNRDLLTQWIK